MNHITDFIRKERKEYKDYVSNKAIEFGNVLHTALMKTEDDTKEEVCKVILKELPYEYAYPTVWWYSVVCNICKNPSFFCDFVKYVRAHKEAFSVNTLYFLFYQLVSLSFRFQETDSDEGKIQLWKLFLEVVEEFRAQIRVCLDEIPMENRNQDLVVVITEQMLGVAHGPTKIALDRCGAIMAGLNKKVFLINTAECLSPVGMIPFMGTMRGTYSSEKLEEEYQEWKGVSIPYFQCEHNMPNVDVLNVLLSNIREMAPCRIVSIGGTSILSNLADRMVPAVAIDLSTDLEYTGTSFQALGGKITDRHRKILRGTGFEESHVIESVFTFSLKPQTEKITRMQLGIPEDKFLLIVVGWRLDDEVTDAFLDAMDQAVTDNMILGFLGVFKEYEQKVSLRRNLHQKARFFGLCDDTLSFMEVCDLYVNPVRKGGGTSCVEAMYKGVPVVTVNYGDVAVNAGDTFCVKDYGEMKARIRQYCEDKEFYNGMSELAKERAQVLLDTEREFIRILDEADKREKAMKNQEV